MNRSRDWLEQAKRDLERAHLDVRFEYWEWACFTAQQAAEKAVKALLLSRGVDAWGHGLTPMLKRLEDVAVPDDVRAKAQLLDAHYIPARFPNGFPAGKPADYYNAEKAHEAIRAANDVLDFCQVHLA